MYAARYLPKQKEMQEKKRFSAGVPFVAEITRFFLNDDNQ
jgi:hypothetical protein